MAVRPVRDLLYIIPLEDEERTPGGLIVPKEGRQRTDQGIVKYRGPLTTGEITVGMHVLFDGWSGNKIIEEDEGALYVMPEDSINGILVDSTEYIMNRSLIKSIIAGLILPAQLAGDDVEKFAERITTALDEHFYAELHF